MLDVVNMLHRHLCEPPVPLKYRIQISESLSLIRTELGRSNAANVQAVLEQPTLPGFYLLCKSRYIIHGWVVGTFESG